MSSNEVNKGGQVGVFDFRQEARGKGFNQAFCDVLPYGIYIGGELTRLSDYRISVSPLVCVIKSDEKDKVATRKETTEDYEMTVSVDKPYIVLRFGWKESETNYMDILAVGWSNASTESNSDKLHLFDLVLGKVIFYKNSSNNEVIVNDHPFDYSRRQNAFLKKLETINDQFKVCSSETNPKKVFISGWTVNTSQGQFHVSGSEFPSDGIPDTTNMNRTDLIVLNAKGEFELILGTPSGTYPALAPKYKTYKVLAEIRRGQNRTNILGTDIVQITDGTIRGQILAEDFPLEDSEDILPSNAKNLEAIINFFMHRDFDLGEAEDVLAFHVTSTVEDENVVHSLQIISDLEYSVD
jgi:hypothetical protein